MMPWKAWSLYISKEHRGFSHNTQLFLLRSVFNINPDMSKLFDRFMQQPNYYGSVPALDSYPILIAKRALCASYPTSLFILWL